MTPNDALMVLLIGREMTEVSQDVNCTLHLRSRTIKYFKWEIKGLKMNGRDDWRTFTDLVENWGRSCTP